MFYLRRPEEFDKGAKHFKNFIKLASRDGAPLFPLFVTVKGRDTQKRDGIPFR